MPTYQETIDVTLGTVSTNPGAFSGLEEGVADAASGGVVRGVGRSKKVNDAIGKMFEAGFGSTARAIKNSADEIDRNTTATQQHIAKLQKDLEKELVTSKRHAISKEIREKRKFLKEENNALQKRINSNMEAYERQSALLERADKRSQKSWYAKAEGAGSALASGVENISGSLTSGSIDPSNLASGLTEGISGIGDVLAGKLAQGGFGKAAAAMSGAAAALAGAAAAIGAVVAVIAAVNSQTVDLNKSITQAIAPIDIMAGKTGRLRSTLKELRVEFINAAMASGLSSEDFIQAASSLSDAGFSMKEFGRITGMAGQEIRAMVGISEQAILASKSLGVEVSEFGSFLKNISNMGGVLEDVTGSFGLISAGAERAGMRTKDFFTAVNEASTGMSLYNFKISDTVGLFSSLTKILGEDLAKERLGLEKTFGGMGIQDRYKDVMVRGQGKTQGILGVGAEKQADAFAEKFAGKVSGLGKVGGTGAIDIEKLGKLNEKQFVKLLTGITAENDKDEDLAKQQLQTLYNISKSTRGGTMSQASALGSTDKLTELSLQLSSASGFFGGKSLGEIAETMTGRSFLEENLGMSGELLEQNIRLDRRFRSEYAKLAEQAKAEGKDIGTYEQELAKGTLTTTEDLKEIASRNLSASEKLGYETLEATTSIADDIKNTIASLLESISTGVDAIVSGMRYFLDDDDEKYKQEQIANLRQALMVAQEEVAIQREEVREARKEYKKFEGDPTKKADLKAKVEAAEEKLRSATGAKSGMRAEISAIAGGASVAEAARVREKSMARATGGEVHRNIQSRAQKRGLQSGGDAISNIQYSPTQKPAGTDVSGAAGRTLGKFSEQLQGLGLSDPERYQQEMMRTKTLSGKMLGEDGSVKEGWQDLQLSSEEMTDVLNELLTNTTLSEEEKQSLKDLTKVSTESEKTASATKGSEKSLAELLKLAQAEDKANLSAVTGKSFGDLEQMNKSQIKAAINASDASEVEKAKARITAGVKDFIYRGDGIKGTITPIDKKDEFYGAKPGGAIDKAMSGGGVVVNISGVGSPEEVARAVATTLKKMGYGNARMYKN